MVQVLRSQNLLKANADSIQWIESDMLWVKSPAFFKNLDGIKITKLNVKRILATKKYYDRFFQWGPVTPMYLSHSIKSKMETHRNANEVRHIVKLTLTVLVDRKTILEIGLSMIFIDVSTAMSGYFISTRSIGYKIISDALEQLGLLKKYEIVLAPKFGVDFDNNTGEIISDEPIIITTEMSECITAAPERRKS